MYNGNAVLTPLCCTNKSFPVTHMIENHRKQLNTLYNIRNIADERLPAIAVEVLYWAAINCMRISEILGLTNEDYIGNDRFYVKGKKGSESYVARIEGQEPGQQQTDKLGSRYRIFDIKYPRLYRWIRLAGFGALENNRKNCQRTHRHRSVTAKIVYKIAGNKGAKPVLHHRSIRSTAIYTQKEGD